MPRRTFVAGAAALSLPGPGGWSAAGLTDANLHYAPVAVLAAAVKNKRISAAELLELFLRRIEVVNPRLNAMVALRADGARADARAADRDLARCTSRGPLHGVPFSIKDSIDTAGLVTTAGTVGWAHRIPDRDATVVARLRAAGGILMGKTNTPEFTWSDETDNAVYGVTKNPYDLTRTPGGSSGGPVALVATGGTPFDIGSDTGNSIRMPSHNAGVAGIKPTHGRVPKTGHAISYRGIMQSWTQLGPIARHVDDLELLLPIVSGPDDEDPYGMPVALRDSRRATVAGKRVVMFTDNGVHHPTAETRATVENAAKALAAAGAHVEEKLWPELNRATDLWHLIAGADGGEWLRRLLKLAGTPGDGTATAWFADSKPVSSAQLSEWVEDLDQTRADLRRRMSTVDLIVCPVMAMPAVKLGGSTAAGYGDTYNEPHNITGWPVTVVRAGTSPEGLPIGVQLVGQAWREDLTLAAGRVVERALGGWKPSPLFP